MDNNEIFESRINLDLIQNKTALIKNEIGKVIVGQENMMELLLIALLSDGHVLIEGVPGIAKTLTAKLFARSIDVAFSRIQFTPDLMPSDILGTSVFNTSKALFEFNTGPIFSNIVLIDEINRAPAKTQSALFEVMEERQVTVDGKTYHMDYPFLVFATQNPVEHEGTYRLPEAQLDRFLFKINISYPSAAEENKILVNAHNRKGKKEIEEIHAVLNAKEIEELRDKTQQIHIDEKLINYITGIVQKTRNHPSVYLGASPRASLNIMIASKACAAINNRDFVTPDDIKKVVYPTLNHRIYLTPEKELDGSTPEKVIGEIIRTIEIPS